jgi:hypothetical protein
MVFYISSFESKVGCLLLFISLEFENRCIMCRAEAHQLYSRKPIFDSLGFQLFAVLHEEIESEVINNNNL